MFVMCMDCERQDYCRLSKEFNSVLIDDIGKFEDEELNELRAKVDLALGDFKLRLKEIYGIRKGFDIGIHFYNCEDFKSAEVLSGDEDYGKVDDENSEKLNVLVFALYKLAGDCRSKVGVRIPFGMFDKVVQELERYMNVLESGKGIISEN